VLHKIEGLLLDNVTPAPIGFSDEDVYIINKGYKGKDVVVKISTRDEVFYEGNNLNWLADKTYVPKVYEMGMIENHKYVIMEKLRGRMLHEEFLYLPMEEVITLYAKAIRKFHTLPIDGVPFNYQTKQKIKEASNRVREGLVKTQYFEREFKGMSASDVYQLMLSYKQGEDDIVLCHGDVSMPNMIIDENKKIGYIDVSQIGACNRYLDIAIGLRSLRYNLEALNRTLTTEYIELFKNAYGIERIDKKKLMFYILLDELS
jgi:aminoglycoside phosphotransferase